MRIVGTAGHVDHGKSALVAALTGTDPDRWAEERLRGMTLDLGFAHLVLADDVEAGIVDVPGHERFLHNMLAGAAGMDVLLLVIAANEGVMPQTVEHLQILGYLNVRRTIVALTKTDLVSAQELDAARQEIARRMRGTIARDAPVIGVSSVTGAGLDRLRAALTDALRALPPRDADAPVYLPIDRVFTLAGLGTIVTGTLMQGRIAVGDSLVLQPSGKEARVRSIQIFGSSRTHADPGSRVALNVPGVDRHEIARGEVAVGRELTARSSLTVRFTPLAPATALVRRRTPVRAHIGSAEILGTLVIEDASPLSESVRAALHLRQPVVAFPGVRFVLRRPSPKTLIGGGYVEGVRAPGTLEEDAPLEQAVLAVLRERGLQAVDPNAVALAINVREDVAAPLLESLAERGDALALQRPAAYLDGAAARGLLARVAAQLEEAHRSEPWAMGVTSITLSRALDVPEPLLVRVLAAFALDGRVANRGGYYAALDYRPALSPEQRVLFDELIPNVDAQPFLPVAFDEVLLAVKRSHVTGALKSLDTMLAREALVKIGDHLYRSAQIVRIQARVTTYLHEHERMTAAQFRDLLGTSRKYAVPLLEWLDARGTTIRSGDDRVLRKKPQSV